MWQQNCKVTIPEMVVFQDESDRKYGEELVEEARATSTSVATALLTIKNKPVVKGEAERKKSGKI
jgi:hypothetical protein